MGNFAREVFEMIRTILRAALVVAILSAFTPSAASAQDILCPDGLVYVNTVGPNGIGYRVCAKSTRQATQAVGFMGVLDPGRSVSTHVDPNDASARVSASYGYSGVYGGQGYYPPPPDPRLPWALMEALSAGVTVTAFKDQLRRAEADGIRDGQYAAVMAAIEGLQAEIARQRSYLARAIATGNADLERRFEARIADLERELAAAAPEVKPKPAPGGAGSGGGKTEGKKDDEAERRAERMAFCREHPDECRARGATVQGYLDGRLPQSRKR